MFTFLLVVHAIIAAALVTVILMQRSEGGGLGMGSGPSGLMTARGAADFLTRATGVLATLFVLMAFLLAALASMRNSGGHIDTSLAHQGTPGPINAPAAPPTPTGGIPMMGTPTPAAPDNLTSQALAPAPVPNAQQEQKAEKKDQAETRMHSAPTVSSLKTIDTHGATPKVDIEGLSGKSSSAPVASPKVATSASKPEPPASSPSKAIPTINIPAPAPANTGNQQ